MYRWRKCIILAAEGAFKFHWRKRFNYLNRYYPRGILTTCTITRLPTWICMFGERLTSNTWWTYLKIFEEHISTVQRIAFSTAWFGRYLPVFITCIKWFNRFQLWTKGQKSTVIRQIPTSMYIACTSFDQPLNFLAFMYLIHENHTGKLCSVEYTCCRNFVLRMTV